MLCHFIRSIVVMCALLSPAGALAGQPTWTHPLVVQDLFVSVALFPFEGSTGGAQKNIDIRAEIISDLEKNTAFDYAFYCPEGERLNESLGKGFIRAGDNRLKPVEEFWPSRRIHYLVFGGYSETADKIRVEVFMYETRHNMLLFAKAYRLSSDKTSELASLIAKAIEEALLSNEPKSKGKRKENK